MIPGLWCSLFIAVEGLSKISSYTDNGDGTITDHVTGLMWQKFMEQTGWNAAVNWVSAADTGGYTDWRVPSVKELFSLMLYSGECSGDYSLVLFIDPAFDQPIGDTDTGVREIDAQTWSARDYNGTTMNNEIDTAFGVNFVDGRIKTYPKFSQIYSRYVRGTSNYSINKFQNNNDGTISDLATGLMWAQNDTGEGMDWEAALAFGYDSTLAGYTDWRLPTIKELNSIVDYSKAQGEPAIDTSFFQITNTPDPAGSSWYPYFWSSTTLLEGAGSRALYQTFGRALGLQNDTVMDAHGAGSVRGDPKSGDEDDYPMYYQGYQGDIQYVYNYVRIVRDINDIDEPGLTYPIVETNTSSCYSDKQAITCPNPGSNYYGQDGSFPPEDYVEAPTISPTDTVAPTFDPTRTPTEEPTPQPSESPTESPTQNPNYVAPSSSGNMIPLIAGIAAGIVGLIVIVLLILAYLHCNRRTDNGSLEGVQMQPNSDTKMPESRGGMARL